MYDLTGKVALVTGTARHKGLGRQIALRLAGDGADVVVSDKSNLSLVGLDPWEKEEGWLGLPSLVAEIGTMGRRAVAIPADLTVSEEIDSMVATALSEFGKLDILVNNAAMVTRDIGADSPLTSLSEEMWRKTIDVNLTSVFLLSKAVAQSMIERGQGGRIVNISSIRGKRAGVGKGAYAAAKAGVISITQCFAAELAKYSITVNAVCPGQMVTWASRGKAIHADIKGGMSEEEAIAKSYADGTPEIPLGRPGTAAEIANMVLFLASGQSSYITGQAMNVNGGWIMAP